MGVIIPCAGSLTRHTYGLLHAQDHPGQKKHSTDLDKSGSPELLLTDKPVSDQKALTGPQPASQQAAPTAGLACAVISFHIDGRLGSFRLATLHANIEQIGSV